MSFLFGRGGADLISCAAWISGRPFPVQWTWAAPKPDILGEGICQKVTDLGLAFEVEQLVPSPSRYSYTMLDRFEEQRPLAENNIADLFLL